MFDCGVLQWPCLWDQFVAAVDSTDLPDDSKFSYIRASLKGEHKAAIQGLSLTCAHYASGCNKTERQIWTQREYIFYIYSETA